MIIKNKQIKHRLIDLNLTVVDLARVLGFSREHTSGVISGRIMSKRSRRLISVALGRDSAELWEFCDEAKS